MNYPWVKLHKLWVYIHKVYIISNMQNGLTVKPLTHQEIWQSFQLNAELDVIHCWIQQYKINK